MNKHLALYSTELLCSVRKGVMEFEDSERNHATLPVYRYISLTKAIMKNIPALLVVASQKNVRFDCHTGK